jgi:hypothetical protein
MVVGTDGPVSCSADGTILYVAGGVQHSYRCPGNLGCYVLEKTGMGGCAVDDATPPFVTCRGTADCPDTSYCSSNHRTAMPLSYGTCVDGVCDWVPQMAMPCGQGDQCIYGRCATGGISGTTSGGFPWGGNGGNTGNGTGGVGGGDPVPPATDAGGDAADGDANGQ